MARDKFSCIPEGDLSGEALNIKVPGLEMAGKGYLKEWSSDEVEDGQLDIGKFEPEMLDQRSNKPRLNGEY